MKLNTSIKKENIFFFGASSFAAQDLIKELKKKYNVINFSRKKIKNISNVFFDLKKKKIKSFFFINPIKIKYLFLKILLE